jgi:two-component system, NtrC family, response regulator AtoC
MEPEKTMPHPPLQQPIEPVDDLMRVLVVDDEEVIVESIRDYCDDLSITTATDPRRALEELGRAFFDVVVVDYRMPHLTGLDLLLEARRREAYGYGILLTAYADKDLLQRFIHHNLIRRVLEKPLDLTALKAALDEAVAERVQARRDQLERESLRLRAEQVLFDTPSAGYRLIGAGGALREAFALVQRFAGSLENVLVTGETGTGKEVIARTLHALSPRHAAPFVKVNCGALPEGLIESELFGHTRGAYTGADRERKGRIEAAAGGTLFLDEIGELRIDLQSRLLHVVQDRTVERVGSNSAVPVDFRLVTATNRDLRKAAAEGRFREDLYHRIATLIVDLPPLRERREDMGGLVEYFVTEFARQLSRGPMTVSEAAMHRLLAYAWPGNIRELENVLKRAVILAAPGRGTLDADLLPGIEACAGVAQGRACVAGDGAAPTLEAAFEIICEELRRKRVDIDAVDRGLLAHVLRRFEGSVMDAVRATGIPKDRLYRARGGGD